MNITQTANDKATRIPSAQHVDMKLEGIVIPVSDVDRAKRFYEGIGWRLDADFTLAEDLRILQLTPPYSPCSILFGRGVTTTKPGSFQGLMLIVDDIEAARAELIRRGVEVSEAFHFDKGFRVVGTKERVSGPDPEARSYMTWASFSDPDGNGWLLQEVKMRLPGRVWPGATNGGLDVSSVTELLRETEHHHGQYEATAPKHHWSGWYAAYIVARVRGRTAEEAAQDAAQHLESTLQ